LENMKRRSAYCAIGFLVLGSTLGWVAHNSVDAGFKRARSFLIRKETAKLVSLYSQVTCPHDATVIAYFGQSNSTNIVDKKADVRIPNNLLQFDWRTGRCYRYKEPLLGTTGRGGNTITYAAVELALITEKPIIIIPYGVGGSSVIDWAYGYLSHHHQNVMRMARAHQLMPTVFLWHQGERDSRVIDGEMYLESLPYFTAPDARTLGLDQDSYSEALISLVSESREMFPDAYFGLALVSGCGGRKHEPIRAAQAEAAKKIEKVFISADSDNIAGTGMRYDPCHFSSHGAKRLGEEYFATVSPLLNPK